MYLQVILTIVTIEIAVGLYLYADAHKARSLNINFDPGFEDMPETRFKVKKVKKDVKAKKPS